MKPKKRRTRKYTPKPRKLPNLFRTYNMFAPIEDTLKEILNTGNADAIHGVEVFYYSGKDEYFTLSPAIKGICEMYTLWGKWKNREVDVEPLWLLTKKLDYSMPLATADVHAALHVVGVLKGLPVTTEESNEMLRICQLKDEIHLR